VMSARRRLSVAGAMMAAMSKTAEKIERVTLSTLKQLGWIDGAVKQFLGEPEALAPNPNYRTGPKMRLYDLPRVEATEISKPWQTWRKAMKSRREKASSPLGADEQCAREPGRRAQRGRDRPSTVFERRAMACCGR